MSEFNDVDEEFDPGDFESGEVEVTSDDLLEMLFDRVVESTVDEETAPIPEVKKMDSTTHSQWAIGGNGRYQPVGATVKTVPPGIYTMWSQPGSWGIEHQSLSSDGIYLLPDMSTEEVLKDVHKFWESEARYRKHNLLYKRGILMHGAPGSGKTVAVKLLMNEIVKRGGIVLLVQHVGLAIEAVKAIRRIEPTRHIVTVMEDLDEIIYQQGEANVLSLLDGEANVDNILNLATTNYPDKLGARIINRPSRFDRRVHVLMPNDEARKAYLQKSTNDGIEGDTLTKWVAETKDMSIAHLRELVAAVYCLEQEYEVVMGRLKDMAVMPESDSGFKRKGNFGFNAKVPPSYSEVSNG